MATTNNDLIDGAVLKKDIYKDNTLLLKKGIILNAYLINKLNKFGIYTNYVKEETEKNIDKLQSAFATVEAIIYQKNVFDVRKTKDVLKYAGFNLSNILLLKDLQELSLDNRDVSYIFVDSVYYNEDFLEKITLLNLRKKVTIFVLGCENHTPKRISVNTDLQLVKFLYRPLENNYIKALLNLYS